MIKHLLNLNKSTRIITILLSTLLLLPSIARAEETITYGLTVGGVEITSENASNIFSSNDDFNYKRVSFTPATDDNSNNILTLTGAEISSEETPVIVSSLQNLVIKLIGRNRLECSNKNVIFSTNKNGYLTITEDSSNPDAEASLILATNEDISVIEGFGDITCTLTPYVTNEDFEPIKEMTNVAYDKENNVLKVNGNNVKSIYYSNQPISYGITIAGTEVTSNNASNIIVNGENGGKVSYDPETNTLTLKGISITDKIEMTSAEDLTIALDGENSITTTSGAAISTDAEIAPTLSFVLADGASNAKLTMTNGANDVSSVSGFTWRESDSGFYVLREYSETTKKTIVTSTLFSRGNGAKDNPFIISSLQDFKDFVHYMNDRDGVNPPICMAYFRLDEDIDCSEFTDFAPIDGGDQPFMGSFDGNGKTISNITYSTPYTSANVGLFNSIRSGGVVKNLTLNNCSFSGGVCTGAIASYLEGTISNCNIINCTITTGNAQSPTAGGIVGYIYSGSIENCIVSGSTIKAQPTGNTDWISSNNGTAYAGGIGGQLLSSGAIKSCEVNSSNIFASHPNSIGALGAGGIVGVCMSEGTISDNTVKGTTKISSKSLTEEDNRNNACAGAIVGTKGSATFTNNTYEYSVTTEEAETNTQSEPATKSGYIHRGIGEKIYNEIYNSYDNSSDIFDNNGIVLANIKKVTLTQNSDAKGDIWIKESYQRDLGEGTFEEYIVTGQEAVIGASMSEPYAIASFTVTTSGSETISTALDNEAIGDGVPAYVFTMPNDDVTVSAIFGIDIANANISLDNNKTEFTYTGGKKSPIITSMVIAEETENPEITPSYSFTLTSDDYTVSYKTINGTTETDINTDDVVNVGSYKMILKGKGDYFGTKEIPFQIKEQAISGPITITLSATSLPYNGKVQKPTITEVSFIQETVDSGEPFKVTTTNYDATFCDGFTDVGNYTISVSLKGNYSGEATATFSITEATMTVSAEGYKGAYDNKAHGITVTAPEGATVKYGTQEGTYDLTASPTYTDASTYIVYYQVTKENYTTITGNATVEISKADITPTITLEGWTYGTTAKTPSITGNTGNGNVTYTYKAEGSETFVDTKPEAVGTHTIKASIAETTNYNAGEATSTFTISAANMTVTAEGFKGTYDNKAHGITVTAPENATVKYGTQKGTYNLSASPTYTDAGTYKVHYQVTMDNYTTVTDSATVEISKAAGGLEYSTATASAELNSDGWTAPELKNPNSLAVTYTSSNTDVAKISETGVVTLVGAGETTIKAASEGDTNHEACEAQYVLTVSQGKTQGYGVWVGETEVDEDNCEDILNDGEKDNDGEYTKIPSFIFNPDENTLLIINSDAGLTIESRIPELKIHLSNDNKLKKIFYNNQGKSENTGTLLFTCDSNFPGSVTIGNTVGESAISGFTNVSYEFSLQALKPAKAKYTNGQMTDSLGVVADTITVGTPLKPIQNNDKEELDADDFTVTNPDGSSATLDLTSANVNDIYYTLPESTEGQGYDPETNSINVIDPMTDDAVDQIAAATTNKNTTVGSSDYAESFIGVTFIVQGGEGVIRIDQKTEEGYEFHLKIGDKPSIALKSGKEEITYSLPDATYCWLYLVRNAALARGGTRVNKRDHLPGNIRLIKVQSKTVASTKSAKAASGGAISPKANNAITGIVDINKDTPESKYNVETVNDKWYTIDGRRIDKPTKKGLYIRNRKKVVVK